jgi:RHS repeat-associated protein
LAGISDYESDNGTYFSSVKGQVTATRTQVLDENAFTASAQWLTGELYYDGRYRVIKSVTDLYPANVVDDKATNYEITSVNYDFVGKVENTSLTHYFEGTTKTIDERYEYDHAGRLLKTWHDYDGKGEVLLVDNTYNELGELVTKKVGQTSTGETVQQMDYTYNIRGWLTGINEDMLSGVGGNKKFAMKLGYNNPAEGLGAGAQYNGNISSMTWRTEAGGTVTGDLCAYGYNYDALNRLTEANYGQGTGAVARNPAYDVTIGGYDLNGNIGSLTRKKAGTLIDDLTYGYLGNQLSFVNDSWDDATGFKEKSSTGMEYQYDLNGNMTRDDNKGLTNVAYNHLNLPELLTGDDNKIIRYIYDANGQKVAQAYNDGSGGMTTYYAGGFIYEEANLKQVLHGEGYIDDGGKYQYYLKDHLGNTRVMVSADNTTAQVNTYYPFGMNAELYNSGSNNKFRYNGKELQTEDIGSGELDWYDYGARFYDASLGRFHTQDRFAEKYFDFSPYQYAANNPICNIDVNGDSVNVASMQAYDKKNGTNYLQTMITDLESQTGLSFSVSSTGQLVYKKDKDGNAVISTKKDANGTEVQVGSKEARDIMTDNISHSTTAYARITKNGSSAPVNGGLINLDPNQISGMMNGATNLDSKTLGWGMTFMHESLHSVLGGGMRDHLPAGSETGEVVDRMNIVRQELNQKGANYGIRKSYKAITFSQTGRPAYVSFDRSSKADIMTGVKPSLFSSYVIIP